MRKTILLYVLIIFVSCQKNDENLEVQTPPFITNAGKDFLNVQEFEVRLNADNVKANERGSWAVFSGLIDEKVYFEEQSDPKTVFHGLPGEEYKLVWKLDSIGKIATDTVNVIFAPLQTKITNTSPDFYTTKLLLQAKSYDKGVWTIGGNYHKIWNQNWGGLSIPDEESPYIKFYGFENTNYKLTWTTWYGSKTASSTIEFKSGDYHQDEALEELNALDRPWRYKKDENGNVIYLNMAGDSYAGRIGSQVSYPEMRALKYLKTLYLSGDGFYHFPEVIASNYLDLEVLDISFNAISSLPENIGNLAKLDTLIISNNQDRKILPSLPDSFGNLKNLRYLDLHSMGITSLPDSFCNLTNLKFLDLEQNTINKLPDNFGNLKNLETFRGPFLLQNIPNSFSELEKLKFCFFHTEFERPILPSDFGKLQNLETFWLTGEYQSFPDSFTNLINLRDLRMIGSKLKELPVNFGNLIKLENLEVKGSFITLPNSFTSLINLKKLTIYGELESLPEKFSNLSKLEYLTLWNLGLSELPEDFGNLVNLKNFGASENNINHIPESFGNLKKLTQLDLRYNNIKTFPDSISNLADNLYEFKIFGNNYSDEELERLKKLLPKTRIIY